MMSSEVGAGVTGNMVTDTKTHDGVFEHKGISIWWLFFAGSVVLLAWVGNLYLPYLELSVPGLPEMQLVRERGTFGDQFGAVNALFSGLALTGLVYGILQQQVTLNVARDELNIARHEATRTKTMLDEQREALEEQNRVNRKQAFESNLFELLRKNTEVLEVATEGNPKSKFHNKGAIAFEVTLENYNHQVQSKTVGYEWTGFYTSHQSTFSNYAWHSSLVIEFIIEANYASFGFDTEEEGRQFYFNLFFLQIPPNAIWGLAACYLHEQFSNVLSSALTVDIIAFAKRAGIFGYSPSIIEAYKELSCSEEISA
ncbi:hypothetical protein [Pseudovibrio sp. Ad26]|uniref:hypothetical protein n=1 Tax=Pseudovibrio sp. Ad26 TaxID=989410 RepID=UPI0007B269FB|nr:hypothetical protein [Pseudovibrio sp. Ad26]KZL12911.1 hypothetical protein PsAD26_02489 [Pseudovibrio sp. Ad26]